MPFTSETAHTGTQFKPGQSGNPKGLPKGYKHMSTWIKQILHDEKFMAQLAEQGIDTFKSKYPVEAIIKVQLIKALEGDTKAMDTLSKFGYGTKLDIDIEASGEQKLIIETRHAGSIEAAKVIEAEVIQHIAEESNS